MNVTPQSPFDVTFRDPSRNRSGTFDAASPRGLGLGAHLTNPEAFSLAQHNTFIGVLTRAVAAGGPTTLQRFQGFQMGSPVPIGWEWPFKAGEEVSIEQPREMELEGSDLIQLSGTGAIDTNTAVASKLSYLNGRLRVTQGSELANAVLTANNLTPFTEGAVRIRVEVKQ